jgi:hypothetical protein
MPTSTDSFSRGVSKARSGQSRAPRSHAEPLVPTIGHSMSRPSTVTHDHRRRTVTGHSCDDPSVQKETQSGTSEPESFLDRTAVQV